MSLTDWLASSRKAANKPSTQPVQPTVSPGSYGSITGGQPASNLNVQQTHATPTQQGATSTPGPNNLVEWLNNARNPGQQTTGQTGTSPMQGGGNNFNIPTNLYPTSGGGSSSSSSSQSHSGINWDSDLAQGLIGQLLSGAQGLPGLASSMGDTLQNQYTNLMDRAMGPDAFQGTLNDLASRGMIDSSVAGNAMGRAGAGIAKMVSDKAYESQLQQQDREMKVPSMLADIMGLAQETNSSGQSSSAGSNSSQNPLAPYELMAQMMMY